MGEPMARHWGIPNVTAPMRSGVQPAPEPHIAPNTQRDNVIQLVARSSPARLNSRSKEVEPFIDERELGACGFLVAFLCLVGFILVVSYMGFQSFVS